MAIHAENTRYLDRRVPYGTTYHSSTSVTKHTRESVWDADLSRRKSDAVVRAGIYIVLSHNKTSIGKISILLLRIRRQLNGTMRQSLRAHGKQPVRLEPGRLVPRTLNADSVGAPHSMLMRGPYRC